MSFSGIQGFPLEVTVVACYNLDDKEWISRQDPYVCLEYGGARYRTNTCTDGGRNPTFQAKFIFTLIEGLQELNVVVWNSNTLSSDEHIGTGRIQLYKALCQGYDDASWPLQSKTGRHSGEVRLILHFPNSNKQKAKLGPSAPKYATGLSQSMPTAAYPAAAAPYMATGYLPNPSTYPPTHQYPPVGYPTQPQFPVPLPHASTYYPSAGSSVLYPPSANSYSGIYPPPPSYSGVYPPPPY